MSPVSDSSHPELLVAAYGAGSRRLPQGGCSGASAEARPTATATASPENRNPRPPVRPPLGGPGLPPTPTPHVPPPARLGPSRSRGSGQDGGEARQRAGPPPGGGAGGRGAACAERRITGAPHSPASPTTAASRPPSVGAPLPRQRTGQGGCVQPPEPPGRTGRQRNRWAGAADGAATPPRQAPGAAARPTAPAPRWRCRRGWRGGPGLAEVSGARCKPPSAKMAAGEPQAKKLKLEQKQLR